MRETASLPLCIRGKRRWQKRSRTRQRANSKLPWNATVAKVDDLKKAIKEAKELKQALTGGRPSSSTRYTPFTIFFFLCVLPHVEDGSIALIGATVENPFFYVVSALVSSSETLQFNKLSNDNIKAILRALSRQRKRAGNFKMKITDEALDHLPKSADGAQKS